MCGRYTLIRLADFTDMFPWIRPPSGDVAARFNIAPTQPVAVVPNTGDPAIDFFQWGLIPSWAKDASIGSRLINARAETVAEKPAFRAALKRRRCLVPASGFYEWKKSAEGGGKTPMFIRMKDHKPFAFAGLWEEWVAPDASPRRTCTILTAEPNELVGQIHDRMAVILPPDDYEKWLQPGEIDGAALTGLLRPYPAELMEAYQVSRAVNSPANQGPTLIAPAADPPHPDIRKPVKRTRGGPSDQPTLF